MTIALYRYHAIVAIGTKPLCDSRLFQEDSEAVIWIAEVCVLRLNFMKQESKQAIYEIIKRIDDQLRYEHDVLSLISSLWNVYQISSTGEDSRYNILGDEIDKHYFMNDDWPQDKLY